MVLSDIQDFPEYELKNDGIDLGRDGTVEPWSENEFRDSTDFQRSMTVAIDEFTADGRTFTVTARPDRLDRGDGANYSITPDSGETPTEFTSTMTTMEQVEDAVASYMEQFEGEADAGAYPKTVEELGLGWVLIETEENDYAGVAELSDGMVYLDDGGEIIEEERTFPSKKKVRQAFRAWRDDRHDSIAEARQELNEIRRKRAEEVEEVLGHDSDGTEVMTETEVVEGDSQVIEGDSQIVEGDSQVIEGETTTETVAGGAADMFDSATDTAADAAETARSSVGEFEPRQIPVPVLGAVLLIVAWRVLR